MTDIVHYFNNKDEEYLLDIYIDKEIFATMHPEDFKAFYPDHPIIKNAVHYNIFDYNEFIPH